MTPTLLSILALAIAVLLAVYVWWSHRRTTQLINEVSDTLEGLGAVMEREAERMDAVTAQTERLVSELYPLGFPGDPPRRRFDA